jgi:hypothetical protein
MSTTSNDNALKECVFATLKTECASQPFLARGLISWEHYTSLPHNLCLI